MYFLKTKPNNPFLVMGYHSPTYFCDREKETKKVCDALKNGRNITLLSPRRMGKTGLIHNVFYRLLQENNDIKCFYIDIYSTKNLHQFVTLLAEEIVGSLDDFSEKMLKTIGALMKSMRPALTIDTISGQPTFTFDIRKDKSETGLKEIFDYLQQSEKKCYVAIDEFQQIAEYTEQGTEALLRSHIQFLPNVKFIFAGSKKHIMEAMFSNPNRAFYQSTQKLNLKPIDIQQYFEFAKTHFNKKNSSLTCELFEYIYSSVHKHTWYIQLILNELYNKNLSEPTISDVDEIIEGELEEEDAVYKGYCELLTRGQIEILTAIAKEKQVFAPYENTFVQKYDLPALSSIKRAITSLLNKMFLIKDENGAYSVYDRFFGLWLAKK